MVYAEIGSNFLSQANAVYDDKVEYIEIQHTLTEEQHVLETGENWALKMFTPAIVSQCWDYAMCMIINS